MHGRQALTNVSIDELCALLSRRMNQLDRLSRAVGSIGAARTLVSEAFDAGIAVGRSEQAAVFEARLADLLDQAVAKFDAEAAADAAGDAGDPALNAWREGRRHLWQLVEMSREAAKVELAELGQRASKAHRFIDMRCSEVLRPGPTLRQRAGLWLLAFSERLTERGAA